MESYDEPGPDFVTIMPAIFNRACVVVMTWDYTEREYQIRKCSEAMSQSAAAHLAQSWAVALKVEIR